MSSPAATFKTNHKAACEKDVVTYRKTYATWINDKLAEYVRQTKFSSLDEYYKDELDQIAKLGPCKDPEIRNEKIEGDKGSVEFRYAGGEWVTDHFVKEGDEWKMTFVIPAKP
jgi:hypothetical protein